MLGSEKIWTTESVVAQKSGHYWSSGSGLDFFYVGKNQLETARWRNHPQYPISEDGLLPKPLLVLATAALENLAHHYETWSSHPLLLIQSGTIADADMARVVELMDKKCGVPSACVVDSAVCALASVNRVSGLVISGGVGVTEVVPVWEGHVIRQARQIATSVLNDQRMSETDAEANLRVWFPAQPSASSSSSAASKQKLSSSRSLVSCAVEAIAQSPTSLQPLLWKNILLTGGLCTQFQKTLEKQLTLHAISLGITELNFIRPESPPHLDVIKGAKLWAALPESRKQFIPREVRAFDFMRPFSICIKTGEGYSNKVPSISFQNVSAFSLWLETFHHRIPKTAQYRIVLISSDQHLRSDLLQLVDALESANQTPPIFAASFAAIATPLVPKYKGKIFRPPAAQMSRVVTSLASKFANWEPLSQFG